MPADILRTDNGDGTTTFNHSGKGKETVNSDDADRFEKLYKDQGFRVIRQKQRLTTLFGSQEK